MLTKETNDKKINSLQVIIRFLDDKICDVLQKFCKICAYMYILYCKYDHLYWSTKAFKINA